MRHLTAEDVDRLLPMVAAIEVARATARTVAAGALHAAERIWHAPDGMPGTIGVMPAFLPDDGDDPALFTTKVVGVFPQATPSVGGLIAVQDGTTGAPLATVDAAAVTALRTAAHSGLSMDLLSHADAATVAIIGAGAQGAAHLAAARAVRPITAVRIWNRTPARAEALAEQARADGLAATAHATPGEATRDADIVCVCTNSATPVLTASDIRPGTHVTAIGAFRPDTRELAGDLLAAADLLVVDDRTAAAHEAGDVLMAQAEGAIGPDAVAADLAELVTASDHPDRPPHAITVYKSVGTSAMDAVAVRHLLAADALGWLAVYGTLAPGQPHAELLRTVDGSWHRGTVQGTRLADGWRGYPGLRLDGAGPVPVQVLRTDRLDLADLDAFEGPGYRRRRVVVRLEDRAAVVASTYVLA